MALHLLGFLPMHFPARLIQLRKAANFTQQTLSEAAELHVNQIRRYEAGTAQPTLEALIRLAKALHVSLDSLVFEEGERGPDEDLRLRFEALAQLDSNERMVVKELLDGMLLKTADTFEQDTGQAMDRMLAALVPAITMLLAIVVAVVILAVLRGGAEGGLLTPGLAVGGLVSLLLCALWQLGFPGGDKSSFAVVGAAAFLAASMQMPLTAVALVMEFTHMDHSYLAPALLCAAGAFLTCRVLDKK